MAGSFPFHKFLKSNASSPPPPTPSREKHSDYGKKKSATETPKSPKKKMKKHKEAHHFTTAKEATFSLVSSFQESTDDLKDKVHSRYLDHIYSDQSAAIIDKNKTFDSFIVGPSNRLAFATVQSVAQGPDSQGKYSSLYIHSRSGLGKTHLLHALANEVIRRSPTVKICLISARDFMKKMVNAVRNRDIASFQHKFTEKTDLLMVDDIHELKNKEGTQNEFFHIFNELHAKGKQLLFTSDKSPKEIDGIEDRIKTRFQWGLVLDIQRPDLETRTTILKKKAREIDLLLQEDVIDLVANSCRLSIRELEGALIRLSAYAQVMNVDIDLELSKEVLGLETRSHAKKEKGEEKVSLDAVAQAICRHYKIPLVDLCSRMRNHQVSLARHIGMYLSRKITESTQKEIGHFYGNRDHTSILRALDRIETLMKKDPGLHREIARIEELAHERPFVHLPLP